MIRRSGVSRSVSIDVDLSDVFDEMTDEDFARECAARGLAIVSKGDCEDILRRIRRRDVEGALLALDNALPSEFRGVADSLMRALQQQRMSA